MEIRVSGVGEYNKNNKYWSDYTISMIEKPELYGVEASDTRLVLEASDTCYEGYGSQSPTREQVEQALAFVQENNPQKLAIHCKAGISRSAAIALAILYAEHRDCEKAFNELLRIRPQAFPNKLIVKHIDDIFGLDCKMSAILDKYVDEQNKLLFGDY